MQVVLLVHICKTLKGLEDDVADHLLREELPSLTHQLIDIDVQEFKYEMQVAFLKNHFIQLDYIWM